MKSINFIKMNGAGNDFILIDSQKHSELSLNKDLIISLCNRRKGIGADGILVIRPSANYDYELEYYNSDGSIGSLCGNGARCSIKYVFSKMNSDKKEISFLCNHQVYSGSKFDNELFTFHLNEPADIALDKPIRNRNNSLLYNFADTGSPHVVFIWDEIKTTFDQDFNDFDIYTFGKQIRYHEEFMPNGTNVNVVHINNSIFIRTYERGVEEETLACGTGTVASAIIIYKKF